MIKHIVMFKIKHAENDKDRQEKALRMKEIFESLKNKIDVIQFYEVGINEGKSAFAYDVVINSEFNTWEDLEKYVIHPEHQDAIMMNKMIEKEKAVIDYEI